MKLIQAHFEILSEISYDPDKGWGITELQAIERVGRTCYKSEGRITEDGASARKFVRMLIKNGHEAMLEHSTLSVKFYVDRSVSHEMVRHRLCSFGQESQRYVNYGKEKQGSEIPIIDIAELVGEGEIFEIWLAAMYHAEQAYLRMLEAGATPEIARKVLPNSTKTELVVTANYREWRHLLRLRTANDADPSIRRVCRDLCTELQRHIPVIFDDIKW